MTTNKIDNISVSIISPKLSDNGNRTEIYMLISFGLLFLCYPINLLTGEGILYISIVSILLLNMLFWVIYYYFIDKYVTIGEIIFDSEQLTIKEKNGINIFKIVDITNVTIYYYGFEDEPFLTSYSPYIRSSNGNDNILSFKSGDINLNYRFAISTKKVRTLLNRKLDNYKKLGANIRIEQKQTFIEL